MTTREKPAPKWQQDLRDEIRILAEYHVRRGVPEAAIVDALVCSVAFLIASDGEVDEAAAVCAAANPYLERRQRAIDLYSRAKVGGLVK